MPAFETPIEVRYRDIDSVGHVNNAVYGTYLEHARIRYVQEVVDASTVDEGLVLANVEIDYEQSIEYGDEVVVGVTVTDIGTSSIAMDYEVRANGDLAATGSSVLVTVDPETHEPRRVPDAWRENIAAHEERRI